MEKFEGRNYYELLCVSRAASKEEIKQAYRSLAQLYHPESPFYADLVKNTQNPKRLDTLFKAINNAYRTLANDDLRAQYDEQLVLEEQLWGDDEFSPEAMLNDPPNQPIGGSKGAAIFIVTVSACVMLFTAYTVFGVII